MALSVNPQALTNLVRFTPSSAVGGAVPAGKSAPGDRGTLLQAQRQLFDVFQSIVALDTAVNGTSRLRLSLPVARSEPGLPLDLSAYAARLESTEEINATPTSFTPFGPDWDGASTSLLTVLGVYDGSDGTGDLTFEVRRAGERGVDRPRIRVYDPQGNTIRTFTVRENHALDREYDLRNGLAVTVGAGFLVNLDTALMQVSALVGSAVDPGKPFNGLRNDNPNFQFGLPSIRNGSFQVNGETIAVNAGDDLNGVITRINQSAAGVTATFDALAERIEFVQDTVGDAPTIDLSGDTSNFLTATKLSAAAVLPGKDPDTQRALADVPAFGGASSGSFTVNGQAIALDVQNDSLDDVIARINSAGAGAVASFDPASSQLTLAAAEGTDQLELSSNGTALFAALNLPEGRVEPQAREGGGSQRRIRKIVAAVDDLANGLNALFSDRGLLNGKDARIIALRGQLESAIRQALGGDALVQDSGIGLKFRARRSSGAFGDFVTLDKGGLTRLLKRQGSRVAGFFNGSEDQQGFASAVASALDGSIRAISRTLGSRGALVDVSA